MTGSSRSRYAVAAVLTGGGWVDELDDGLDAIARACVDTVTAGGGPREVADVLSIEGVVAEDPELDPVGDEIAAAVHAAVVGDRTEAAA